MEEKRSFGLKKKDLFVLGALILTAALCWIWYSSTYRAPQEKNMAVIMVDGKEVLRLNLLSEEDQRFSLEERFGVPVSFEIKAHKIRFVQVTCPDHICEGAGFLSQEGQSAVCMPNRTSVSIYGEEG